MKEKNYTITFIKFIASLFVILIHVKFPGQYGKGFDCLARFAVPFFFTVSGFFSYNISTKNILKRIKRNASLYFTCTVLYAFYYILNELCFNGMSVTQFIRNYLNKRSLYDFLVFGRNPFAFHLWFLFALIAIYIFYYFYNKVFKDNKDKYRVLYTISIFCLIGMAIMSVIHSVDDTIIQRDFYRNWLFLGLPFFVLGIYEHEHIDNIKGMQLDETQLGIILFITSVLSLLQYKYIGKTELPLAFIFVPHCLMTYAICNPKPGYLKPFLKYQSIFDKMAMEIYILHPLIFFLFYFHLRISGFKLPILVIICSLLLSFIVVKGKEYLYKKQFGKVESL